MSRGDRSVCRCPTSWPNISACTLATPRTTAEASTMARDSNQSAKNRPPPKSAGRRAPWLGSTGAGDRRSPGEPSHAGGRRSRGRWESLLESRVTFPRAATLSRRARRHRHRETLSGGRRRERSAVYQRPPPPRRPPPPPPPALRPPPPPVDSRGRASFTVKLRPWKSAPFSAWIALSASSSFGISTKPKPFDLRSTGQ